MSSFLLFVRNVAPGLYLLGIFGVIRGLLSYLSARQSLSVAQFRLERENAEELGGYGITMSVISLEVILLVWVLANVTHTAWTDLSFNQQPDDTGETRQFQTAVPQNIGSGLEVPTALPDGPELIRTQPPSPTPAGTLRPADAPVGCIRDQAFIDIPDNGQVVFQTESIIGTANIDRFGYYRFEIRSMETGSAFGVIGGAESDYPNPVVEGPLGSIVPQNFVPGEYRFRMVVFDSAGINRAGCEITIFISEPLPTPTPIGGGIVQPTPAGIPAPTAAP